MTSVDLQPNNATPLERAASFGIDSYVRTAAGVQRMHGLKQIEKPSYLLPFLVYEYGLGELTPWVPNLYDLIREGIKWQRVRGTPDAVDRALAWLDYAAEIEEWPTRRRKWNLFMLALNRVRDDDELDLPRIDGVANRSVPLRSYFWRGFHGYDVRALEYSRSKYSQTLYSTFSGTRIPDVNAKWSYGRRYEIDHVLTQSELEGLGVWTEPVDDGDSGWWDFPWPDLPWTTTAAALRSDAMLDALPAGPVWAAFKNAAGEIIGYRRARARHRVTAAAAGQYRLGSSRYRVNTAGLQLYVEAMTNWGDGYGSEATSVGFIFGGDPHELPIGKMWLPADGLEDPGPIVAETNFAIPFGRTVRERVCAILRF